MYPIAGAIRKVIFGVSPRQTSFERRGFRLDSESARMHLEKVGQAFTYGYNRALVDSRPGPLAAYLAEYNNDWRGFAFEGAAMGLALQDLMSPFRHDRFETFLKGPGQDHIYMMHVGYGWALARTGRRISRALTRLDPLLGWLAIDGLGFHDMFFNCAKVLTEKTYPRQITGYARNAYDQGQGRCLWFVCGINIDETAHVIEGYPGARQSDLWAGVGLAAAYAGGAAEDQLRRLCHHAGKYHPSLAQGAAFGAKARLRAGNLSDRTQQACRIICNCSAERAAAITDQALASLTGKSDETDYEIWRLAIQKRFSRPAANPGADDVSAEVPTS